MRQQGNLNLNHTAISNTPDQDENWIYDPTGNWDHYTRTSSTGNLFNVNQTRSHNPVNEITTIDSSAAQVAYDKAGNMTRIPRGELPVEGDYTATWDAWNRLGVRR